MTFFFRNRNLANNSLEKVGVHIVSKCLGFWGYIDELLNAVFNLCQENKSCTNPFLVKIPILWCFQEVLKGNIGQKYVKTVVNIASMVRAKQGGKVSHAYDITFNIVPQS